MLRWGRFLLPVVLLLGVALLAAGCGDDDDGDDATAASTQPSREPAAKNQAPGGNYVVTVTNNSTQFVDFVIYQTNQSLGPDVRSLAWLVQPASPNTTVKFEWGPPWAFVWGTTGSLKPGVNFQAEQTVPADPSTAEGDSIELDERDGALGFYEAKPNQAPPVDSLTVGVQAAVRPNEASVGVALSRKPLYVVQAEPNLNAVFPTEENEYYVAAGSFQGGEVLDIEELTNAAELTFGDVTALTAVYKPDHTWTVTPGSPDG